MQYLRSRQPTTFDWIGGLALALSLGACSPSVSTESVSAEPPISEEILSEQSSDSERESLDPTGNNETFQLSSSGIGPIQVGMTIDEAETVSDSVLEPSGDEPSNQCQYVEQQDGPPELGFMIVEGQIARIDVNPRILSETDGEIKIVEVDSKLMTSEGISIGSSPAEVLKAYPAADYDSGGRMGRYITFREASADSEGIDYGLIFETDAEGTQVTAMRGGRFPEVQYLEGCS